MKKVGAGIAETQSDDAWFGDIVDAAPDALLVVAADGRIRYANCAAERLFGYTRGAMVGQSANLLINNPSPPEPDGGGPTAAVRRSAIAPEVGLTARKKNGTEFLVDATRSVAKTTAGEFVLVAVHDRRDEKYAGLLDAAPDAMVAVDTGGIIRLVNKQAEAMFGYDRLELVGSDIERLIPQRHRAVHPAHRQSYMKDPRTRPMGAGLTLSALRKDGTEFPVDIALSSIETRDGNLVSAAIRDITARIEDERQRRAIQDELHEARLRQAQRLETVGQLAGGIAHDFNNLLAVILNYADFMHDELPDGQMKRDVVEIQRAASRAADLTRQLLIFARREVTKPELLDINAVVGGVENLLRRTIGEHVEFVTVLHPDLPSVRADPGQLEQVFMNLAVNARDAMPNGGRLVVETKLVELDDVYADAHPGVTPGRYIRLSVSDTGAGMTPAVAARAFEPFFTTKPAGTGTGLGLATVYGIVTHAGGNVRIYSELGHGTLVAIHLPAIDEPAATTMRGSETMDLPQGSGETILVVEDEPAVLLAAIRILSTNGYHVPAQSDPVEAASIAADRDRKIDALLTDVMMPGISGVEVARRARAVNPGLPVLFMSGYSTEMVETQGVIDRASGLLQKPFTRVELLSAVRAVLPARRGD